MSDDPRVTKRAREALADCEYALADFDAGANTPYQRPRWVAVITLLRAVGDVLTKVDRRITNAAGRAAITRFWDGLLDTKPEPRIFWDFIHDERQQVVHFYDLSARANITIKFGASGSDPASGVPLDWLPQAPSTVDWVMHKGPFAGRDPRELCREAIEFWRVSCDEIDRQANGQAAADVPSQRPATPWRQRADDWAQDCLALNRQPTTPSGRGAPHKPESVILPLVIGDIMKQENVTQRRACYMLAEHLIASPKLTDADRAVLSGIPKPGATRDEIKAYADRLRKSR